MKRERGALRVRFGKLNIEHEILLKSGTFSAKKNLRLCGLFSEFKGDGMGRTAQASNVASHLKINLHFESGKRISLCGSILRLGSGKDELKLL